MHSRMILVAMLLLVLVAKPTSGQSESPEPSASLATSTSHISEAEPSPTVAEPVMMTAAEVAKALLETVAGTHPRASYDAVVKDVLGYFRQHPEAVFAPRRGAKEWVPRRVFPACGNARGLARDDACAASAADLFYAYLVTRDDTMLDLIDRFLGATTRLVSKKVYRQRVAGLAPIVINENAKLFRVPVDLPPVIDEAHVAVMVIDPGPFPGQFAKSMTFLAEAYGLEVPKRLVELPAVVVPDIDLATATQIVEFLGRGGPTLGITDAGMEAEVFGGSPSSPEPSLSPKPSVAPAGL